MSKQSETDVSPGKLSHEVSELQLSIEDTIRVIDELCDQNDKIIDVMDTFLSRNQNSKRAKVLELKQKYALKAANLRIKTSERLNMLLQQKTGADVNAWLRRAQEFIDEPERREILLAKLGSLAKRWIDIDKTTNTLYAPIEIVAKPEIDKESGLQTIYFKRKKYHVQGIGISLLPIGARITDIQLPKALMGPRVNVLSNQDKPDQHHFLVTGTIADFVGSDDKEEALLGKVRDGRVIKDFENKNPSSDTNEWESGGIGVTNSGELDILPYSSLIDIKNLSEYKIMEQVIFIADKHTYEKILMLPEYRIGYSPAFIGYFLKKNGEKEYFVAYGHTAAGIWGIPDVLKAINEVGNRENIINWYIACLDLGGVYAGLARTSGDKLEAYGPSTFGTQEIKDPGHSRLSFFDFYWPK